MFKKKPSFKMLSLLLAMAMIVTSVAPMPVKAAVVTTEKNILAGLQPVSNADTIQGAEMATDGVVDGSNFDNNNTKITAGDEIGGADNGYSTWQPVYLQYDFGQIQQVKEIDLYRNTYDNAVSTFKEVKVELSKDAEFTESTVVFDTADYEETVDTKGLPQVIVPETPVEAQYIRIWQKGHYIQNTNSSWKGYSNGVLFNEIEVLADVTEETPDPEPEPGTEEMVDANILLGKVPATNSTHKQVVGGPTVPQVYIKNPAAATDGEIGGSDDDNNNTKIIAGDEIGGSDNGYSGWDPVYLEYDFEKPRMVKEIHLYRNTYPAAVSDFKDVKVELSMTSDFAESTVLFEGGDYKETVSSKGQAQVLALEEPVEAQYIRIWQKGHYIQNTNSSWKGYSNGVLFNEIEVIASVPKSELPAPPPEAEKYNIALNKIPYVRGLTPTNIEAITDGNVDDNYAVHNSTGQRWLQFEYKNSYSMKEIKFKLEEGTYKSVRVSVSSNPTSEGTVVFDERNYTQGPDMEVINLGKKGQKGKYVRFTVEKDANSPVKYSEVEIWATGDNYDESKPEYAAPQSKYDTLVWNDEFDGDVVDESKWQIIDGMANHGAIYNRDAVSIKKDEEGSYLAINSKNYGTTDALIEAVGWDQYQDQELNRQKVTWSSGRVESKDKFSFQFGRMAVKAKPNDSKGIWPAIWMLCQDETGHDEIDVLEYLGQDSWDAWTTNHYGILDYNKGSHGISTKNYEAWCQDFHVFEVEWDPEYIAFFIDGKQVHRTSQAKGGSIDGMHTRPMFAILETQVGDGWVGDVDYSKQDTKQDSDFLIDWVRVYQTAEQPVTRFDNLENIYGNNEDYTTSEGYSIKPYAATKGLLEYSAGNAQYEDKDNFYYGGQPRYEESRIAPADREGEQSITYQVPGVKDVHLTTYYQTLNDYFQWSGQAGSNKGKSIRNSVPYGTDIDFKVFTSANGKDWTEFNNMHVVDNFPEAFPAYARITFDAYGVPDGTNYIKVVFPAFKGAKYSLRSGDAKDVVNTDIQLAKVTFLQTKGAVMPEPDLNSIQITTEPSKTEYTEGETFDAKGMVVKAQWSDDTETDVTKDIQIKDADKALEVGEKEVVVTYTKGDVTVEAKQAITVKAKPVVLRSIQITTEPSKTEYTEGETFDAKGMAVKAQWSNDTETDVTKDIQIKDAGKALAVGDKEVVVTYTKGDVTAEAKQAITVNEKKDIGFKAIGKTWYYFDQDGNKVTGWKEVDGYWYYFYESGAMVKGWQQIGTHTFYFNGSGHMLTGWRLIEGKWYYFYDSGRMLTGWQQINGEWYYLNADGSMVTGWLKSGPNWFYFKADGSMATGWQAVGTKWYYFYESGRMLTGWQQIDGTWYYLKSSGEMVKGWQKIGRNTFYFNGSGHMLTGKQKIDGKWYTFAESGALIK